MGCISFGNYASLWLAQRTDIRARIKEHYGWLIRNRLVPSPESGCPIDVTFSLCVIAWRACTSNALRSSEACS